MIIDGNPNSVRFNKIAHRRLLNIQDKSIESYTPIKKHDCVVFSV